VSEEVWEAIGKHGRFRENDDDVLRRLLNVDGSPKVDGDNANQEPTRPRAWKQRRATKEMTQNNCRNNELVLKFEDGVTFRMPLPAKHDIPGIRRIRDAAVEFVTKNGGTQGQECAAIRALTSNGYHVTGRTEYA
jgi:hypothetical protein